LQSFPNLLAARESTGVNDQGMSKRMETINNILTRRDEINSNIQIVNKYNKFEIMFMDCFSLSNTRENNSH
jgi:hypothetical protein